MHDIPVTIQHEPEKLLESVFVYIFIISQKHNR